MPFPPKNINVMDIEKQLRQELEKIYQYYKKYIDLKKCPKCNKSLEDHEYDVSYSDYDIGVLFFINCYNCNFQITNDANVNYNKPIKPKPTPVRQQYERKGVTFFPSGVCFPKINIFKIVYKFFIIIFKYFYQWEDRSIERNINKIIPLD